MVGTATARTRLHNLCSLVRACACSTQCICMSKLKTVAKPHGCRDRFEHCPVLYLFGYKRVGCGVCVGGGGWGFLPKESPVEEKT